MDYYSYLRAVLALVFVLGLIGICVYVARRFLLEKSFCLKNGAKKRLSVIETCLVDTKRRLILVKRDEKEHLILLGQANDLVIESNIDTKGA